MLKEIPNVKLLPEHEVKGGDAFNDGDKALYKFINGDLGVDELTNQLTGHLKAEQTNDQA
ncbi:MAG: hypothetical protein COT26_01045 [Candidatus Kerfeldbacteria bacterium CG08_land_8_20_14_0_20_43_14]|uniref:Uncharacterized protein n=1 Tax=Candidatus Kerfeldbacteria bacterium CG08_land_8_20_14_0_20_43_14 TaxID=2014246 RepID=A0A2H0YSZ3_9BACT|nr:MAG: hypothetical protein COT26_01045 [Candidatus Kerfeldbacteria bacterium CG08_land_8_20_14_0_20_43_14]